MHFLTMFVIQNAQCNVPRCISTSTRTTPMIGASVCAFEGAFEGALLDALVGRLDE